MGSDDKAMGEPTVDEADPFGERSFLELAMECADCMSCAMMWVVKVFGTDICRSLYNQ